MNRMNRKLASAIVAFGLTVASAVMIPGMAMADDSQNFSVEQDTLSYVPAQGVITFTGENMTSETLGDVFVTFNLYDSDGTQIGNAIAQASQVAAGGKVKMTAQVVPGSKVASYKVVKITTSNN